MANPSFMYDEGGNAIGVSADRQPPLVIPPSMKNLPNAPTAPAQAPLVMPKGQLPTEGQTIPGQAPLNIPGNLQRALRTTQGPSDRSVLPPANNVARPAVPAQFQAPGMPTPEQMLNNPNLLSGVGAKDIGRLREEQFSLGQAGAKEEAQAKIDQANNLAKAEKSRTELIQKMGDEQKAAIEQHKKDIQESSPFAPTQESAKDVAQLFSLITVAAFGSGGKGKYAGMQTLASLTGAMKGYQEGRKDVYEKDIKAFEENLKVLKTHNDKVNALYEDAMKLLSTNKELGLQKIQQLIAEDNTGIAARLARSGQYKALGEAIGTVTAALQAAQDKIDKRNQEFALLSQRFKNEKMLEAAKEPTPFQTPDGNFVAWNAEKQAYVPVAGAVGGMTKVGSAGGKGSMSSQAFKQQQSRFLNSISEGASALESLGRMNVKTTGKLFDQDKTLNGLFTSPLKALDSKLSSEDSQIISQRMAGIAQNLASVETLGAATGLAGLRSGLESRLKIPPNASVAVALNALGDMRQIIESAVDAQSRDPNVLPEIKAANKQYMDRIRKAIPFTLEDLDNARAASIGALKIPKEDEKMTFTEFAKRYGEGKAQEKLIQVTDPDGGVHTFKNQADAQAFKQAAGIK